MRKINSIILVFLFLILVIPSISAVCTLTFDSDSYLLGSTAIVTGNCDAVNEKNTAYTINWTNGSGVQVHVDTGTTPSLQGTNFFENFTLNSSYVTNFGGTINVNMTGTNLEGTDTATVTSATVNDLIITNISFSQNKFLGSIVGFEFLVLDSNDKKVSNALCTVHIDDTDNFPKITSFENRISFNGETEFSQYISALEFQEGIDYLATIHCLCGINNTERTCFNEDGDRLLQSSGKASSVFTTNTWLTSNTVTNKNNYLGREEMMICANLTNVEYDKRIPVEIYHQVRCSNGLDNDDDRDRALIFSDDGMPDERGISTNTTQMQCKRFVIPEPHYLQGRSSECYASTSVWVLDDNRQKIKSYVTSSSKFNITITDLNIDADWERIKEHVFYAEINLSHDHFSMYNGTGIGNIDIRLDKQYIESIKAEDQHFRYPLKIDSFIEIDHILNITSYNKSHDMMTWAIEILDDGNIEVEIRDVDVSSIGWYNITVEVKNFEERTAIALENASIFYNESAYQLGVIANKTGTFLLSVDCPNQANANSDMTCTISAQVEDPGVFNKEVNFNCYILTETNAKTSIVNWNKMITRDLYTTQQDFFIPVSLETNYEYSLICEASYYNLGSRTDSFSDTFTVKDSTREDNPSYGGSISEVSPNVTEEEIIEIEEEIDEGVIEDIKQIIEKRLPNEVIGVKTPWYLWFSLIIIFFFLISFIILFIFIRKKRCEKEE